MLAIFDRRRSLEFFARHPGEGRDPVPLTPGVWSHRVSAFAGTTVTLRGGPRRERCNAIAIKAYRDGTLPFPDGTVLAKLAWKHVASPEFEPASIPGAATTVQFMVKDSKKYAATGGWGFGRFVDGKPADEVQHRSCFACHQARVKNHDLVFTRYAP
jgi:hypothetical protein